MCTASKERSTQVGVYDVVNVATYDPPVDRHEANAISIGECDRGVEVMVAKLRDRVRWSGRISLLRIHGAGGPGVQTISCSEVPEHAECATSRSVISCDNFEEIRDSLAPLRGCFSRGAVVWLVGCEPGPKSARLIDELAALWNVVVTMGPARYARQGTADPFGYNTSTVTSIV